MDNNDVLRQLRFILDLDDSQTIKLFGKGNYLATRAQVSNWLKRDDNPENQNLFDNQFAAFLNGLIIEKRGYKEGPQPIAEDRLGNNLILKKLKIAFQLNSDDILEIFESVGVKVSPHELSAFFRKPTHKHYRICNDQYLRNFLYGLKKKLS